MSDYRQMGQAMRRRAGASSSTLGGADKKVSVEVPDAISDMLNASSARLSVGAVRGKLIPKKNTQAADPTVMGPKQSVLLCRQVLKNLDQHAELLLHTLLLLQKQRQL